MLEQLQQALRDADERDMVYECVDTLREALPALLECVEATREVLRISDRKHDAWDRAKAALAKLENTK